jgi:hypothetical protein
VTGEPLAADVVAFFTEDVMRGADASVDVLDMEGEGWRYRYFLTLSEGGVTAKVGADSLSTIRGLAEAVLRRCDWEEANRGR